MKDPKTENYLNAGNYKWKYVAKWLLDEIDIKVSIENPSRLLRAVNQEVALNYGLAMEAGDVFPAIVLLTREPPLKPIIATGVHRVEAAKLAHIDYFDAYVVTEPDPYRIELLIRQLNTIETPLGVTIEDRISQVLLMHEKWPDKPLAEHAREWHFKPEMVQKAWQAQEALKRAQRAGYDLSKAKIAKGTTVALHTIKNENVYNKAVQLAITPGVSAKQIEEMVKDVKKAPQHTEAAEMAVVDRYGKEITQARINAQATRGKTSSTEATRLIGYCRATLRHIQQKGLEQLHLAALIDPYSAQIVVEELMKNLKSVATELEKIQRIRASAGTSATAAVH